MRAVWMRAFGPAESHKVEDVPSPVPGPGQVLIDVQAMGVNFPDLLVVEGKYQVKPPLPASPGKEGAGVVAAVGPGVTTTKVGDRVAFQVEHGAFAEQALAPEGMVFVLPEGLDFPQAAALGLVSLTAFFALQRHARLQPGERVFVPGAAGGVGLATLQIARALGGVPIAGVRHGAQHALVRAHGAEAVVDLSVPDLKDGLRDQLRKVTGGHGADVVVDAVGGDVFDAALRALAWHGRMVSIGYASGRIPSVQANYLLLKNLFVSGLMWTDYRDREPESVRAAHAQILDWWRARKLRMPIMASFPLSRFHEALAALRAGRVQGKIVLTRG
ncbi:MAG: NADPH:quinone oxidoreductase family protein [Alphaproteobacteria bacterium]|nr:NADPH:quinone oxidoreductase family protein [Alphaproteobacteria bacterium]